VTYLKSNNFEGAKFSSWIVKLQNENITYSAPGTWFTQDPPTSSTFRCELDSIETLKDPFGDGISIDGSNSAKLILPQGKYWLDLRLGIYSGTGTYNHYYLFNFAISGWVQSESKEKWLGRNQAAYLEEQTSSPVLRSIQTYYESNSSTDYISCLRRRGWSTWLPGGTPQINKDGSGESGFSTAHPTGASRLLVMRIE
tara:strand:- start:178 stop:771 length:594 start_codon:yes stop_codon:yes gene_type:complete